MNELEKLQMMLDKAVAKHPELEEAVGNLQEELFNLNEPDISDLPGDNEEDMEDMGEMSEEGEEPQDEGDALMIAIGKPKMGKEEIPPELQDEDMMRKKKKM